MVMVGTTTQGAVVRQLPARQGFRLIEYKGDAMTGAHIVPNSKLLLDFSREPQNGDIVVVQRGSKFTVRFFKCNEHKRWLISANRNYADMLYDDDTDTQLAVVVKVVTDTVLLRGYMT
jgi:SOS-response transcriptional repressor LexA